MYLTCFYLRNNVNTRISTWSFGFHSSLKTITLSKFQKQPEHRGRLTHPQRSSLLQYRWSIVCWISIIWIDVMVVSIPEVKRIGREHEFLHRGEELCSRSDPRQTFSPHPNGKSRKKSGQGFCFCLGEWMVTAKFKRLLIKSQALGNSLNHIQKAFLGYRSPAKLEFTRDGGWDETCNLLQEMENELKIQSEQKRKAGTSKTFLKS